MEEQSWERAAGVRQERKGIVAERRPVVAFYKVEEEIFNAAKQRQAVDLTGDDSDSEPESKEEEGNLDEDFIYLYVYFAGCSS